MSVVVEAELFAELYCASCERSLPKGTKCPHCGARLVKLVAATDTFVGRELDGRFTVIEKLGMGGMGAVYRARQHSVGREVAIKIVHANRMSDPTVIKRFLREAKLLSRLNHPNAVGVLDFGQTPDGVFYLVMELVTGHTLDEELRVVGVFPPARVVRIGSQICDALEVAHDMQIVHRDLKPANIMLMSTARDFVKVLDFGIAKSLQAVTESESSMLGTPAFISPERVNHGTCDGRADLYSLGCVLYLLGTGQLPFRSESAHDMVAMHTSREVPSMEGVPRSLAAVIERLLSKDPDDRYQTAAEVRHALEAVLEELTLTGEVRQPTQRPHSPTGPAPMVWMPTVSAPRRPRWPWVVFGLIAAVAIALGIGLTVGDGSHATPVGEAHAASSPGDRPGGHKPRPTDELRDENAPPRTVGNSSADRAQTPVNPDETRPVAPPETRPVAPPETKPVAPPETRPVAPPETRPVAPPETKPVAPPETKPIESKPAPPREVAKVEPKKPIQAEPPKPIAVEERAPKRVAPEPPKKVPVKKPRRIKTPPPQKRVVPPKPDPETVIEPDPDPPPPPPAKLPF